MINEIMALHHEEDRDKRYIGYAEDEPSMWLKGFGNLEEAFRATCDAVLAMMLNNGNGDGVVIDIIEDRVLAIIGYDVDDNDVIPSYTPKVSNKINRRSEYFVLKIVKDNLDGYEMHDGSPIPFFWNTYSD